MRPPESPKPRAEYVRTTYPSSTSCVACSRVELLSPPNPCARTTAGRDSVPAPASAAVSTETSSVTDDPSGSGPTSIWNSSISTDDEMLVLLVEVVRPVSGTTNAEVTRAVSAARQRRTSDLEDELAPNVARLLLVVGLCDLLERVRGRDLRVDGSGVDQRAELGQLGGVGADEHIAATPVQDGAGVEDGDDAARLARERERLLERLAAGEVQGGVDGLVSEVANPFRQAFTVGHRLSAEAAEEVVVGLTGRSDHPGAPGTCELYGEVADAAGCGVDQDQVVVVYPGSLQHLDRGESGERE